MKGLLIVVETFLDILRIICLNDSKFSSINFHTWRKQSSKYENLDIAPFLKLKLHAKNQFIPSIHSCDTVNFWLQWLDWPHTHNHVSQNMWISTQWKKSGYLLDLFWRSGWLKIPAIWLAENILVHITRLKILSNMGFVQE